MVCDTSDLAHIKRYSNTIEATINKGSPSDRRTNAPHKQWFNTRTHTSDERWRSYNRTYVNAHIVSTTNSCVHGPAVKNVSNCELCVYTGMCCIGQSLSLSLSLSLTHTIKCTIYYLWWTLATDMLYVMWHIRYTHNCTNITHIAKSFNYDTSIDHTHTHAYCMGGIDFSNPVLICTKCTTFVYRKPPLL